MKRKLEEDYYLDDEYVDEVVEEVETMELGDCTRCGAHPGFGGNRDLQGYTSCNVDEKSNMVTECNKCEVRCH